MDGTEAHVNFDAPAVLRKWPSLHSERRTEGAGPYLLVDGTLEECIREFMAKPRPCATCTKYILRHNRR
jgi:hypothetical protein